MLIRSITKELDMPARRRGPGGPDEDTVTHDVEDWDDPPVPDTSDLRLDDPAIGDWEPEWVIRGRYIDTDLGTIRSGKEAEVRLVRRTSGSQECLLAAKRYRPRAERAFRREDEYLFGRSVGDERADRAIRKRTRFGRAMLEYAWAYREYPLQRRAWDMGARVPFPVEPLATGLVMQYIGDVAAPAPRLADLRFGTAEAESIVDDVLSSMRCLLDAYLVHGDLSAYNVLWWDDRAWLIDFPQAVDIAQHTNGVELLRRDVRNLAGWAKRCGVQMDPNDITDDLLRSSPIVWS